MMNKKHPGIRRNKGLGDDREEKSEKNGADEVAPIPIYLHVFLSFEYAMIDPMFDLC